MVVKHGVLELYGMKSRSTKNEFATLGDPCALNCVHVRLLDLILYGSCSKPMRATRAPSW